MIPWYIVKFYLQKHFKFCSSTIILLILTLIFYRYIQVFLAAWSFLLGIVVAYSLLSSDAVVPNLLFMYKKEKQTTSGDDELTLMKTICTVCGQRKCPRHRPELNILAFQPWTNLSVTKRVDEAVEEFLNIVLNDYVYTWYRDLSSNEEFMDELKISIRFFAAVMLRRAKKVDIPSMVSEKLLKAGVQHLHAYLQAQKNVQSGMDMQQATLEYLGPHLHCAMQSRKTEIEYLRRTVEAMFPYVLPQQSLKSKSTCALVREILSGFIMLPAMDTLANPDMINNLLLIFLDDTPPPVATEPVSPQVPFLENFAKTLVESNSFLKNEAAINVLQFFLACEDFNKRILSPELSQGELVELHNMAKDLYKSYCAESALDRIKFDEEIVNELKEKGPSDQVIKLRTSTPLFKAYEHAYNLLDKTFLPLFHQSDDYYTMICGDRVQSQITRSTSKQPKKKEFGFSNIGNKIKGVFKSGEVKSLQDDDFLEADTITLASVSSIDDQILESECEGFQEFQSHNLSTWRVTIPRTGARPDPENSKKQYFVFIIDVRRNNKPTGLRYHEFYVLEQKLAEFHGGLLADCQLPPKKSFGTSNYDFIDGKKEVFELYLQKLLTKPYLKGSQLVYNFLTTEQEFTTGFLPDINLGQHLEPFLKSFEQSTEAPKPRPSKPERRDSDASMKSTSSEKLCSSMFENNANCESDAGTPTYTPSSIIGEDLDGVFDIIIYVARFVYKIPEWFHHVLLTARILFKSTLENYLEWYTGQKIQQVSQEHHVLFFDTDPPRTDEQKRERYRNTYKEAFVSIVGTANSEQGTKLMLDLLQQPKLNKQLSYVFLDILILELFPELRA
ncbi:hypothetical protein KUTeg_023873 [Tegillarca granosa]|uniref:Sorting nexin 14 n=1 Tax=Tegillarca granosa TaxID=220873 RepID=A0ABQ9E2Y0_TEGGR|nr:hypothetical protein KUTeg_023873 [Tegillarca granosa]